MAKSTKSTASADSPKEAAPRRGPTTAQIVAAIRYLGRETKREAEVASLLGDEPQNS